MDEDVRHGPTLEDSSSIVDSSEATGTTLAPRWSTPCNSRECTTPTTGHPSLPRSKPLAWMRDKRKRFPTGSCCRNSVT